MLFETNYPESTRRSYLLAINLCLCSQCFVFAKFQNLKTQEENTLALH